MTRLTAIILATRDDLIITHGGPSKDNGKYVGWILKPEDRWAPLLNTEAIFDTAEAAEAYMRWAIEEATAFIKAESGDKHPVEHVLDKASGS